MRVPMATPLVCRKWEKLLSVRTSLVKQMRVSVEGDWLGLRERKKRRAFNPSAWGMQMYRDWMSIVGARELEVLKEVEGMGGVPDMDGEFLDRGEKIESRTQPVRFLLMPSHMVTK
eukprot:g42738.t1